MATRTTAKKAKGLNKQSNYSEPAALFLVHLYATIARLRRETSNKFTFYGKRQKTTIVFFSVNFLSLDTVLLAN